MSAFSRNGNSLQGLRHLVPVQWKGSSELKQLSPQLKAHHVAEIVAVHKDTESVIQFFYWISKRPFYKHNMNCFISMLNRLVRDRVFAPADHIRILMIKACRNEEEIRRVADFLNEISGMGFGFSLYSCNTLLIQLAKFEMVEGARNLYKQMLNSGIQPSLLTFNTLINILSKKGKVREAELILSQIFQYDLSPDVFTYTSLILGHCRNRNLDLAFGVFDRMVKEGCDPNSVTYSTLINGLCNEGSQDEEERLSSKCTDIYSIDQWAVQIRTISTALKIFHWMEGHGSLANTQTYNEIIKGLCLGGDIEKAMVLFEKMLKMGPLPTVVTYNTLINGYLTKGNVNNAARLLDLMKENGCEPDEWTYNELFQVDIALSLLERMEEMGCNPNVESYNAVINGLSKENRFSEAEKICDKMAEQGLLPNLSHLWAVSEGKADEAEILLKEMERKGLAPDEKECLLLEEKVAVQHEAVYSFSPHEKDVNFEIVSNLLARMSEIGCEPTLDTYSTLVSGLCRKGRFYEAEQLVKDMKERGFCPDREIYYSLLIAHCKNLEVDHALKIFHSIEAKGFQLHLSIYRALICALCKAGQVEEAQACLITCLKRNGMQMRLFGQSG
ncbi:Pentatricopeptide repeat-containing protein [Vitis vinifera]|uniref:Pentatricopeptide repeat-containing protein n=1 Tax=Vitis vinifera TaxID=29760 RepID=A0A438DQ92_VITVI|nr:Pentatricopeptide repeat-containing protein [Vitis vinifera]